VLHSLSTVGTCSGLGMGGVCNGGSLNIVCVMDINWQRGGEMSWEMDHHHQQEVDEEEG